MAIEQVKDRVEKVQEGLTAAARQVFLAGLGAAAAADEQGARLLHRFGSDFDRLVARGRKVEAAGEKRLARRKKQVVSAQKKAGAALERALDKVRAGVDAGAGRVAKRLGIPHHEQIQALADRVAELTRKIDSLQRGITTSQPQGR
jgi:poly(hydroxyalkanoate) granule-associated protein